MQRKIGLEEHFAIPETLSDSRGCLPDETWPELRERVLDIHDRRLREMDQHGVEMMILSLNAPAIQAIPDPSRADEIARKANDLAEQVHRVLDRLAVRECGPRHRLVRQRADQRGGPPQDRTHQRAEAVPDAGCVMPCCGRGKRGADLLRERQTTRVAAA
jgi:hypothetical protein